MTTTPAVTDPAPDRVDRLIRIGLGLLVLEGLVIGVHALFFPRYFYDNFFLGAGWLRALGPYSEHLTRDAGALYLGLTLATGYAMVKLIPDFVNGVCLANAVAALPHMIYHLANHDHSGTVATIPQAGTLAVTVLIALWVIWLSNRRGLRVLILRPGQPLPAGAGTDRPLASRRTGR